MSNKSKFTQDEINVLRCALHTNHACCGGCSGDCLGTNILTPLLKKLNIKDFKEFKKLWEASPHEKS